MSIFEGFYSLLIPLFLLVVYIGIPVIVILFLRAALKMVKIMQERNNKLDRLIRVMEEIERNQQNH